MQRHRFYAAPAAFLADRVILDSDESHHLTRVLRLSEGMRIFVFNGAGAEYEAEVSLAHRHATELALIGALENQTESPLQLTLAQAIVKGDKFDLVVQKAVELGVSQIIPLLTEHGFGYGAEGREEKTEQRLQRWRRIALEAVKQCGRRTLVPITSPVRFAEFCQQDTADLRLIMSERGGKTLQELNEFKAETNSLSCCIAAEGGWSDQELETAENSGRIAISLGPRILRTETAAITAVSVLQHLYGDMR